MSAHHKRLHNCYIWLMNMMLYYNDCKQEKNLVYIDFRMHVHLQWNQLKRWRSTFDVDESIWKEYWDHPDEPDKTMPSWFLWVSKWFMHGLNGPFGSVSPVPNIFLPKPQVHEQVARAKLYKVNNLFPNNKSIEFTQDNGWNCGVCCQFFFFDLIVSQHLVSWNCAKNSDGSLPDSIRFGSSILQGEIFDKLPNVNFNIQAHINALYCLFWYKILIMMERLWFLYAEN